MKRVYPGTSVVLSLLIVSLELGTASAADIIVTPDSCATVRWEFEGPYAQLTLDNRCAASVRADVLFSDGTKGSVGYSGCRPNKKCRDSHAKSKARLSFNYCVQYSDYELSNKFGRCP